jgi:uncharacterized protein (DUF2164 family)
MTIKLSDERHGDLLGKLSAFYLEIFDETLSEYQAERLLDFFIRKLGPEVYNQAIQDSRKFMLEKLEDLDAEFVITETEK